MPINTLKMLSLCLFFMTASVGLQNVSSLHAAVCTLQLEELADLKGLVKRQVFLQKAVEECPDDARINFFYGYNLERLRKYEQAIRYYEKAVSLEPQFAKSYFGLGDVYLVLGKNKEAIVFFEKGLTLDPDNIWARRSLQEAREGLEQTIITAGLESEVESQQESSIVSSPQDKIIIAAVDEPVDEPVEEGEIEKDENLSSLIDVPVTKNDEKMVVSEERVESQTPLESLAHDSVENDSLTTESFIQRMVHQPQELEDGRVSVLQMQIQFMISSGELTDDAKNKLGSIVCKALQSEELSDDHFEVAGHTDNSGDFELNMLLSKKRAEGVKKHLVEQCGISSERLTTVYFGQTRPAVPNLTVRNRQLNRRVEFRRLQISGN